MAELLVVLGAGGHAKVVIEAALARQPDRRIAIIDDDPAAQDRNILGFRVSGTRVSLASNFPDAPVALGIGNNAARVMTLEALLDLGRRIETIVHPSAIVGNTVQIGAGSFLAAGSIITADTAIGRGAIINTAASVDHDCVIGDGAHIGPGARLCGNVRIGDRTLVGVGSSVRPGIAIGADVTIGAGSAVVCDLSDGQVYGGCPARPLR
jgi:sugar O-acyltransferase (sialic acid O-acetyltransferase NeuD family)